MSKKEENQPLITDNGNIILDAYFERIENDFEIKIKKIKGVLESGLFIGYSFTLMKSN